MSIQFIGHLEVIPGASVKVTTTVKRKRHYLGPCKDRSESQML